MATDIPGRVLDGAALALYAIRQQCSPAEAQVSLALLIGFLCSQGEVSSSTFLRVLDANVKQLASDPILLSRVVERMHNVSKGSMLLPSGTGPEHHYKVGDLLRKQKH